MRPANPFLTRNFTSKLNLWQYERMGSWSKAFRLTAIFLVLFTAAEVFAIQSATCAYLAALTLPGLGINAVFHIHWIDSAAALAALPFLFIEGSRAMHGESCC
jgi:hypothetical protein